MRGFTVAASALAVMMATRIAGAQTPSADDIISGLRPNAQQLNGPTRGIRKLQTPGASAGADASSGRAAAHSASYRADREATTEAPSVKLTVDFRSGSADLTPAATRTLDQLGRALSSSTLAAFRFRVEGHTDTVGSPETNMALSQRRAETVATYLETKFGIAASRIDAVGKGSEELAVQTPDQTPEPRNRRVKVVNLGS